MLASKIRYRLCWQLLTLWAIVGSGLSVYSLMHHHAALTRLDTGFACNLNRTFNCDAVARSPYSTDFLGHPAGLYGLAYFLSLLAIAAWAWRRPELREGLSKSYGAMILIGLGVCAYMAFLSFYALGTFCLTCVGLYTVCCLQALTALPMYREMTPFKKVKQLLPGGMLATGITLVSLLAYQPFKPLALQSREVDSVALMDHDEIMEAYLHDLQFPELLLEKTERGENYWRGQPQAKVVITEFIDHECPYCSQFQKFVKKIMADFPQQIKVILRHYPLDPRCNRYQFSGGHESSCAAAVAARCLGDRDKFWQFTDEVLAIPFRFGDLTSTYENLLQERGVKPETYKACRESRQIMAKIKEDIELGAKIGIKGTPGVFINGRQFKMDKLSQKSLFQVVQALLKEPPPPPPTP